MVVCRISFLLFFQLPDDCSSFNTSCPERTYVGNYEYTNILTQKRHLSPRKSLQQWWTCFMLKVDRNTLLICKTKATSWLSHLHAHIEGCYLIHKAPSDCKARQVLSYPAHVVRDARHMFSPYRLSKSLMLAQFQKIDCRPRQWETLLPLPGFLPDHICTG